MGTNPKVIPTVAGFLENTVVTRSATVKRDFRDPGGKRGINGDDAGGGPLQRKEELGYMPMVDGKVVPWINPREQELAILLTPSQSDARPVPWTPKEVADAISTEGKREEEDVDGIHAGIHAADARHPFWKQFPPAPDTSGKLQIP